MATIDRKRAMAATRLVPDNALIVDERNQPEAKAILSEQRGDMFEALYDLPPLEAHVLALRYGLGGEPPLSLEEVAGRIGGTRLQVRKVEVAGLRSLRRMV